MEKTLIYLINAQDGINEASLIIEILPACLIRLKSASKEAKNQKSISEAARLLDSLVENFLFAQEKLSVIITSKMRLKTYENAPSENISTYFGRSRAHDINHPSFIFKPLHSPSANSSTIMFNFQSRKTTFIVSSVDQVLIKVV